MEELSDSVWFHQCYDVMMNGICIIRADGSGGIIFANRQLLKMYDCASQDEFMALTGGKVDGLSFDRDMPKLDFSIMQLQKVFHFTYQTGKKYMRSAEGIYQKVSFNGKTYFLLQAINLQAALSDGNIDEVTGLPAISKFYEQALNLAHKNTGTDSFVQYCPVWFNIANFRGFNREYGTEAGDRCLAFAASQLKKTFPDGLFGRTEADNFLALVPRAGLEEKIDEVCASVNHYMGQHSYAMKAGIVKFDQDMPAEVIRHSFDMARIASISVKNDGEHSYAIFQKEMEEKLEKRRYILDHFDQALEEGYIKVYFQPVVRTLSHKVCSFEVLSRWEDPEKGMISPEIFVPVLEQARRIGRLDQYMIEHTVETIHDLLESGRKVVPVSLNLSQLDFDLIQPLKCLMDACEKYKLNSPNWVIVPVHVQQHS